MLEFLLRYGVACESERKEMEGWEGYVGAFLRS